MVSSPPASFPSLPRVLVEACVDTVHSAMAAERGGAHRLELCDDLVEGGTTPSIGTIATVRERVAIPLFVLVRPRAGDFLYDADDRAVMLRDIAAARDAGANGVVIGALTPDGHVDRETTAALLEQARPMAVTFHRAFDVTNDLAVALDDLMALGVERVLTSGGAPTALEGAVTLASLVRRAGDGIAIVAGGRIDESNARRVLLASRVRELHVRATERVESAMRFRRPEVAFGKSYQPDEYARTVTSAHRVAEVIHATR